MDSIASPLLSLVYEHFGLSGTKRAEMSSIVSDIFFQVLILLL